VVASVKSQFAKLNSEIIVNKDVQNIPHVDRSAKFSKAYFEKCLANS